MKAITLHQPYASLGRASTLEDDDMRLNLDVYPGDDIRVMCHADGKVSICSLLPEQVRLLDDYHERYAASDEALQGPQGEMPG